LLYSEVKTYDACCRQVELDNSNVVDMPDGFPSTPHKRGHDHIITLRFPRFNTTVFYDPTIDSTQEEATYDDDIVPTDGGTAPFASMLPLSVALLLAVAATELALCA